MAFAPSSTYYNSGDSSIIGRFYEKGYGNLFEFSMADDAVFHPDLRTGKNTEYPHLIWVTEPCPGIDHGWRRALVKKTVAYVVVDENETGYVIERWHLKSRTNYDDGAGMRTPCEKLFDILSD